MSVTGLDDAIEGLDAMRDRLTHITPALDEIAADLKGFIEERFETRTAPDGTPWLPVTDHTERYRETDGLGLKRSRFATVLYSRVQYGTKASFSYVHQEGDKRNPPRPFAPTDADQSGPAEELRDEAKRVLVRYVQTGQRGG